jgi:DNA-directed RNA polymerase specialized sigma24 family protein
VKIPTPSKPEWKLTAEVFAKLLTNFDPDPEKAGIKYEALRRKLVKFFDWRGAYFPEECADESFDRIARKIEHGEVISEIVTYAHGVARLVLLEELKSSNHQRVDFETLPPIAVNPIEFPEANPQSDCFDHCLQELSLANKQLILDYYQHDRREKIDLRMALAANYGIPMNALRSRVQRLRNKLEECVKKCLENSAT